MALDLDTPNLPTPGPAAQQVGRAGRPRLVEPSIPVYRYFLSGGPDQFRLTVVSAAGLAVVSLGSVVLAQRLTGYVASPIAGIGLPMSAAGVSLSLAALVSRWASRGTGLFAAYLAMSGWTAWSCCSPPDPMLAVGAALMAILVFALAELPNRKATSRRALAGVAFYLNVGLSWILAGPIFVMPVAAVCLGTVLGTENSRGIRFFTSRAGLGILGVGAAIRAITHGAEGFSILCFEPAYGTYLSGLAAGGLAAGAVVTFVSVRNGHGASGLGRLLISWLLSPSLLATLGIIPVATAIAITMPAWAAVAGIALTDLGRHLRARRARCSLA